MSYGVSLISCNLRIRLPRCESAGTHQAELNRYFLLGSSLMVARAELPRSHVTSRVKNSFVAMFFPTVPCRSWF